MPVVDEPTSVATVNPSRFQAVTADDGGAGIMTKSPLTSSTVSRSQILPTLQGSRSPTTMAKQARVAKRLVFGRMMFFGHSLVLVGGAELFEFLLQARSMLLDVDDEANVLATPNLLDGVAHAREQRDLAPVDLRDRDLDVDPLP